VIAQVVVNPNLPYDHDHDGLNLNLKIQY